jgi:hypothetical protein
MSAAAELEFASPAAPRRDRGFWLAEIRAARYDIAAGIRRLRAADNALAAIGADAQDTPGETL